MFVASLISMDINVRTYLHVPSLVRTRKLFDDVLRVRLGHLNEVALHHLLELLQCSAVQCSVV